MAKMITTKAKKAKRFVLSNVDYEKYQEERERPRGAFASVWTPDKSPVSLHKVRVEKSAIARIEKSSKKGARKSSLVPDGLFVK